MDMKRLIEKMDQFAGQAVGQKPGDQVRGTEKATKKKSGEHPFKGRLVGGAAESILRELDKQIVEGKEERNLLEEYQRFSNNWCHVCGQSPCNCTSLAEGSKDSAPKMGSQERRMAAGAVKGGKDMAAALGLVRGKDGVARIPKDKKKGVAEGAEFGAYYYEQLAQQTFDINPNLQDENEILNLGYKIAKGEMGSRAQGIFRDEDFPSDFVSAYSWLKKQGVAEAVTAPTTAPGQPPQPNQQPNQQQQQKSPEEQAMLKQQQAKMQQNIANLKTAGVQIDPAKAAQSLQKTDTGAPMSAMDKDNIAKMAPALGNVLSNPQTAMQLNTLIKKAGGGV